MSIDLLWTQRGRAEEAVVAGHRLLDAGL